MQNSNTNVLIINNLLLILPRISCMALSSVSLYFMSYFRKTFSYSFQSKHFFCPFIVAQISENRERPKDFVSYVHVKVDYTHFDFEILLASGAQQHAPIFWSVLLSQISISFKEKKKQYTHCQCETEPMKTLDKYHRICTSTTFAYSHFILLNNGFPHIKALDNK